MADKKQRTMIGCVTSDKMTDSATVRVERRVAHSVYHKIMTRSQKIRIHDPKNECTIGDTVKIAETTPKSKTKAWELAEIVEKAK